MAKRPRTQRRAEQRALDRMGDKLERLAAAEPGGSPERPLRVATPSVIESQARAQRCPRCQGEVDLKGDSVLFRAGEQLRRVDLACRVCHRSRALWFVLGPGPSN